MAEQVFRQPLRVLPIVRPDTNVTMLVTQSPTAKNKRTHECLETDTKAIKQGTVTPTKASATPLATNSRKSVKRVKAEVNLKGDADVVAARLRVNAEADFAAKMKVWIASYKREFPSLRFYFDACSDEDVRRCTRKIVSLGGSVEPFFSIKVNIVVTTREVPKPLAVPESIDHNAEHNQTQDDVNCQTQFAIPANKISNLPIHHGLKFLNPPARADPQTHDVLIKAQAMNIKIWSLKKLRDSVLRNLVADQPVVPGQRSLSNTLKTEKYLGTGEENIAHFKGPYILVRDMHEEHRPIMSREWPTVSCTKDGEWPQWRATRPGRCPFIRDRTAESGKVSTRVTRVKPERPLMLNHIQHANASGIQQITSAIQSNIGRSGWSGKENMGSGIANLHKKAVTAKRVSKLQPTVDPTDAKQVKVDIKAGYCENCKEKFDDFDAHLRTRTHRAYARNEANFAELDDLLASLLRLPRFETTALQI